MKEEQLRNKLWDIVTKEFDEFKKEQLQNSKEEIFENAYKISTLSDFVDMCEVQPLPSDSNKLFAHLVFNNEMKEKIRNGEADKISILNIIKDSIAPILNDLDFVPNLYKIDNEFPMAISGKRDVKKLKEDCIDLIEVKNEEKVLRLV